MFPSFASVAKLYSTMVPASKAETPFELAMALEPYPAPAPPSIAKTRLSFSVAASSIRVERLTRSSGWSSKILSSKVPSGAGA